MITKNRLCVIAAAGLIIVSIGTSGLRRAVLGRETRVPAGLGNYKVTMVARGVSQAEARLLTLCPLDFHRQHVYGEAFTSAEYFPKLSEVKNGEKRLVQWTPRVGSGAEPFEVRYEFRCTVDVHRPSAPMTRLHKALHGPPPPGEFTAKSPGIDPSHADLTTLALDLTAGLDKPFDQARVLFDYVDRQITKDPGAGASASAVDCLAQGRGDALAKCRLLAGLLRNRGIPTRLVHGLVLHKVDEQKPHVWIEAWLGEHWFPLCPYFRHVGKLPGNYLVFGFGDLALVRGLNIRELDYSFLIERQARAGEEAAAEASALQRFLRRTSVLALAPAEFRLVEFLLLLPLAALIICLYRNVIGLSSFGTFAPALIGLAFREFASLPGILVFVSILLVGWCLRRGLDWFHLLQVPRSALMLSLVVALLTAAVIAANYHDLTATRYISLFPMVILTGMIERFWTLENEDSTWASFKTLFSTLLIAGTISMVVSIKPLVRHLLHYPESLGLIMAALLLLGRYTGYRLLELWRFRDLAVSADGVFSEKVVIDALAIPRRAAIADEGDFGDESAQCRIYSRS